MRAGNPEEGNEKSFLTGLGNMGRRLEVLRILVVDDDDVLMADAGSLQDPAIAFSALSPSQALASQGSFSDRDVVVAGVDSPAGLDLVANLCRRPGMPPVIALGGKGSPGKSLEHVLLLAELRGAALSLPKPIDAAELVLAAIELIRRKPDAADYSCIAKDLERRLAW
jgi:DNA-binding response OmpR family regulator